MPWDLLILRFKATKQKTPDFWLITIEFNKT
jgi:hypothetical protein